MRTRFDKQLEQLHVELIKMGSLCEQAITLAAQALDQFYMRSEEHTSELQSR